MHDLGVAAMRLSIIHEYRPRIWVLSVALATVFFFAGHDRS
jgi:hypothetical protein